MGDDGFRIVRKGRGSREASLTNLLESVLATIPVEASNQVAGSQSTVLHINSTFSTIHAPPQVPPYVPRLNELHHKPVGTDTVNVEAKLFECTCGKKLKTRSGFTGHQRRCSVVTSALFMAPNVKLSPSIEEQSVKEASPVEQIAAQTVNVESSGPAPKKRRTTRSGPPLLLPDELPSQLRELERTFQCLNTVHSFCAVQRQMVCTYDGLKDSVKQLSGSKLKLSDLGSMRAVAPSLIMLYWARRTDLEDASVRELLNPDDNGYREYSLVIEFRDARPVRLPGKIRLRDADGQHLGWRTSTLAEQIGLSEKSSSVPVLIERRNRNFREFLINYWKKCLEEGTDPIEKLSDLALQAVPVQPGQMWPEGYEGKPETDGAPLRPSSLTGLLDELKTEQFYRQQISDEAVQIDSARSPEYGELDQPLSADLTAAINAASNITRLYTHQAKPINFVEQGHNVVVSTSTSSGKSLIYQLPVLRALENDPTVRAIYIFPTKALAQDQKRSLISILSHTTNLQWVDVDTYDGDTPYRDGTRDAIRAKASVIFTNPDMLHVSILPGHKQWKVWLERLRYVIVDELHYYAATFGAHCAMVMRRLRRLCHIYGNDTVRFISCSATVANPAEHMTSFFGLPESAVRVVDVDGAPRGRKLHIIWNPPLKDPRRPGQGRCSSLEETVKLIAYLVVRGVRTICFAKVRTMCELLLREAHALLHEVAPGFVNKVMSYRGGYTPEDRRKIERQMFQGELLCIVATNALELGVDIGSLDAVMHVGFPFNLASYRQQSGRAGRRERDSMSILVAEGDNPLDQFYANHPKELYSSTLESSGVEVSNELVVETHLQCAAFEWPLIPNRDFEYFGDFEFIEGLCSKFLRWDTIHEVYFACSKYASHPSRQIQIRSIDEDVYRVIDVTINKQIEEVEASRVPFTLYEGSIFIHQGQSYLVFEVDAERKCGKVRPTSVDFITANRDFTNVDPMKTIESRPATTHKTPVQASGHTKALFAYYGEMRVVTTVFGYFKINPRTRRVLEAVEGLENPPITKTRYGFWIDVPEDTVQALRNATLNVEYSIHGASHALISLLPTYVMIPTTGQTDIRTECKHPAATRPRPPRIVVYDSASGKGGVTYKAFKHISDLLVRARQVVESCDCLEGCPGCIHRSACSEANEALSKTGAIIVLKGMCGDLAV
ncbi:ATP-dependent 3'-5' DNA helicase [Spizellomyces punctatus DAOM BR117]|uniref:DEAD/DEAH box helicase domain-containing protein n=1 Tax=Spizellomyces punctatus (strain DAOM BR117) TaxID=645134 RepID=A0A0L0HGG0_SPIPD|nr:ATP-dependent 3'-5' DNA helicase [Spizellomyces punctatus DAOM BR117]KND00097.1 hypothetical protein SPPG_04438 [Spizellomyces punctatus DAOM BR117]|eukprot:XP_016608136.1 hypothetical protein SPPG_04438 [Spizellomyces punctatus DAOM BR117]